MTDDAYKWYCLLRRVLAIVSPYESRMPGSVYLELKGAREAVMIAGAYLDRRKDDAATST